MDNEVLIYGATLIENTGLHGYMRGHNCVRLGVKYIWPGKHDLISLFPWTHTSELVGSIYHTLNPIYWAWF